MDYKEVREQLAGIIASRLDDATPQELLKHLDEAATPEAEKGREQFERIVAFLLSLKQSPVERRPRNLINATTKDKDGNPYAMTVAETNKYLLQQRRKGGSVTFAAPEKILTYNNPLTTEEQSIITDVCRYIQRSFAKVYRDFDGVPMVSAALNWREWLELRGKVYDSKNIKSEKALLMVAASKTITYKANTLAIVTRGGKPTIKPVTRENTTGQLIAVENMQIKTPADTETKTAAIPIVAIQQKMFDLVLTDESDNTIADYVKFYALPAGVSDLANVLLNHFAEAVPSKKYRIGSLLTLTNQTKPERARKMLLKALEELKKSKNIVYTVSSDDKFVTIKKIDPK